MALLHCGAVLQSVFLAVVSCQAWAECQTWAMLQRQQQTVHVTLSAFHSSPAFSGMRNCREVSELVSTQNRAKSGTNLLTYRAISRYRSVEPGVRILRFVMQGIITEPDKSTMHRANRGRG